MARPTNTKPYRTYDTQLVLRESGSAITSDGYVGNVVDFGGDALDGNVGVGAAEMRADLVVDVAAIDIADNDELYEIILVGSDSATIAGTEEEIARFHVGAKEVLIGTDVDSTTGRYVVPFYNHRNGTHYRYCKLNVQVSGTSPSIDIAAFIAKRAG
jgi:hypothetical protein